MVCSSSELSLLILFFCTKIDLDILLDFVDWSNVFLDIADCIIC